MAATTTRTIAALFVGAFMAGELAACTHDGHAGSQSIPFTAATVTGSSTGTTTLAWNAPGAGSIAVFSGADPAHFDSGRAVAQGTASDSALVAELPPVPRRYFQLVPDRGAALALADRSLHLASAPNFRDAGGYRTAEGKWVRMGLLYRSDQLDRLSPADLDTLHAIGVKLVCDLRTDAERKQGMDKLPAGAEPLIADVAGENSASSDLSKLLSKGGDAQTVLGNGKAAQFMIDANRQFVESPSAKQAYKLLFERLADPKMLPGTFHCSAGKDRTGWAAAIFLSIMGVPRETIMQDYLLSNTYLAAKNQKMLGALKGRIDPALLQPLLEVRPEYLQAAFDAVDKDYGSMDRYVREGLGLSDATIRALRSEFLVG
jgi:protein-tyrosine phosphatase